jgi:Holliday junction DNA helicase RuvA
MICGLHGILEGRGSDFVIINVGGVSLRVQVPASSDLGGIGSRVKLYTHLQVREENIALYGFSSAEELELFSALISASGVGPKVALSLLSALTPLQLTSAIASGNAEVLSQVPGVGKRTAARLVLELKDKLDRLGIAAPVPQVDAEVLAALKSLGYSVSEATSALATIPDAPDLTTEDKLKLALQYLATAK